MKGLYASFWAETLKVRKSKIFIISILAFSAIAILMGLMVLIIKHPWLVGQSTLLSAKSTLFKDNWESYFEILIQIILGFGIIGFGMVSSWVFGQEFVDRTATYLLSLPVNRSTIVLSKFIIIIIWSLLLALILFIVGLITGLAVNIADWSLETTYHYFSVFLGASLLTILISTPVAFIASFSRGYMAALGYVIATLFITNMIPIAIPSIIPYIPWAIPALYTGLLGPNFASPGLVSYIILFSTCILGLLSTMAWWRFTDQV